jgi:hypothetical protein
MVMPPPEHDSIILAHEERFKTIFSRIKAVEDVTIEHVRESVPYRKAVERHTVQLEEWIDFRRELRLWALGIICSVLVMTFWLGGRFAVLDKLEKFYDKNIKVYAETTK